jgi:hypothetical protein
MTGARLLQKCGCFVVALPLRQATRRLDMIVLCVAEKSSIAKSITQILSGGQYNTVSSPRTRPCIACRSSFSGRDLTDQFSRTNNKKLQIRLSKNTRNIYRHLCRRPSHRARLYASAFNTFSLATTIMTVFSIRSVAASHRFIISGSNDTCILTTLFHLAWQRWWFWRL